MFRKYYKQANDDIKITPEKIQNTIDYAFSKPKKVNLRVVYPCAAALVIVVGSIFAYPKLIDKPITDTDGLLPIVSTVTPTHNTDKSFDNIESTDVPQNSVEKQENKDNFQKSDSSISKKTDKKENNIPEKKSEVIVATHNTQENTTVATPNVVSTDEYKTVSDTEQTIENKTSETKIDSNVKNTNDTAIISKEETIVPANDTAKISENFVEDTEKSLSDNILLAKGLQMDQGDINKNSISQKQMTNKEYADYLGFDIENKISLPTGFKKSGENEQSLYYDDENMLVMDEGRFSYEAPQGKYLDIVTSKLNIGEVENILKNSEYEKKNVGNIETGWISYEDNHTIYFIYNGVAFILIGTNIDRVDLTYAIERITK